MAIIVGQNAGVHFGKVKKELVKWRDKPDDKDPDDELLEKTPEDVVRILGFDPLEFEEKSKGNLQTRNIKEN